VKGVGGVQCREKKTFSAEGHKQGSKVDAIRCDEFHGRQGDGVITNLTAHPVFYFQIDGRQLKHDNGRRVAYTADFQYFHGDKNIVEDGKPTSVLAMSRDWPLRKAVFKALYPYIELREIKKVKGR